MANVQISQLPAAGSITGTELVPVVQNGVTVQTTTGAIAASPSQTQTFVTVNQEPTLPNSRAISGGTGVGVTDNGAQSTIAVSLNGVSGSLESAGNGMIAKVGGSAIARTIAATGAGLTVTNGDGQSGAPTIGLSGLPLSLAGLSGSGILALPNNGTVTARTITATASQTSVTDGDGASGNPTIGLASNPVLPGTASATLPIGDTAQRGTAANGQIRYNTDSSRFEGYQGGSWYNFGRNDGTVTQVTGTPNQIAVANQTTTPVVSIVSDAVLPGLGGVVVPVGTTVQRPITPTNGTLRYNTSTATFEGYANGVWGAIAAGGGVTSVGTGVGLLGGPITSAGTIDIDTTVVATLSGTQTLTGKTISGASNTLSNIGNASLTNSSVTIGTDSLSLGGTLSTLNGVSISGSANTLSSIGNSSLTNSSLTLGTTTVSLGATATSLAGLSSVAVTGNPTTALELTTKQYVDNIVASGVSYHTPVRLESPDSAGNLNATYNNGTAGVGATLTNAGTQVALSIDGVATVVNDRVLIYNQTNAAENGVYTVTDIGSGSTNWVLTRATDANTYGPGPNSIDEGSAFFVTAGNTGAGETYVITTVGTITFGTTPITFAQIAAAQVYTAGTGLTLTGTQFSLTAPVTAALGGTGQTSYTSGDLIYASGTTALSKLAAGTNGYLLTMNAGLPSWQPAPATGVTSFSAGTTGLTPSTGTTGAVTLAGTLVVSNGGTGLTSVTANRIPYGNGTSALQTSANLTFDGTTLTNTGNAIVSDNSANAALRITQVGAGNALLVEDSANPDSTPFVINASGVVIQGKTTARTNYFGGVATALLQGQDFISVDRGGAFDAGPAFILSKNRGATGDNTIVVANDTFGQISFQGADGTNLIPAAQIQAQVDGTPGTNDMPGRLMFATTADGASSPTERMRIDSAGRVGIGGTATTGEMVAIRNTAETTATVFGLRNLLNVNQATTTTVYGISDQTQILSPAALTNLFRFRAASGGFTGTVTNQYGFAADSGLTGATNNYGFHSNIASGTGRWNFYAAGTATNYFEGSVGVGIAAPVSKLDVYAASGYVDARVRSGSNQSYIATDGSASYFGTYNNIPVIFSTGNITQFTIAHTASAVNYLQVTGGATGSATTLSAQGSDTNIGITITPKGTGVATISATTALTVPAGTTAQRPTAVTGMIRYNSTTGGFEGYSGASWGSLGGGNTTTQGLWENNATISANYTIATGNNAMSAGPITIASGVVVTVPSGSTWSIV